MELVKMPTDRNKVSAYLSDQDFALLGDLASKHRVSKSQMVALAIRYMSKDNTSTNIITNLTDNLSIESKVSDSTVESLVESKLVELLSNPTVEVKNNLETLFKDYVTCNGIVGSSNNLQDSKVSDSTVEVLDSSEVTNNGSEFTVEVLSNSNGTDSSSEVTTFEKTPSEDSLEGASNDNQVSKTIETIEPVVEAKSEEIPESEEDKGLSAQDLADKLKVRADYLSRWKSGKKSLLKTATIIKPIRNSLNIALRKGKEIKDQNII